MAIIKKSTNNKNAGVDVDKRDLSCTLGGNVNWYSHYVEHNRESLNTKN